MSGRGESVRESGGCLLVLMMLGDACVLSRERETESKREDAKIQGP